MRLGFEATPLLGPRSGVGHYTSRLLRNLITQNEGWAYLLYSNRQLELEEPLQTAALVPGYLPVSRWLWMQAVLPQLIRRSKPDLCHYPNASAPLYQTTPFILTIHDASLFLYAHYHPRKRLFAIRLFLPALARRAAAVITVSHHARRDIVQALSLPPDKVKVVYNAAPPHFQPVTDPTQLAQLRHHYHLPKRYILYLGTLEPRKNLVRLVRSFAQVHRQKPDVHLLLAGPSGWMMEGLQREVLQLGLETAVRYLGYIPTIDLPGVLSLAQCLAFPSLYEGFGLPALEAMACGTPVLTSSNSAMAEVCGSAAYLVEPTDEGALTYGLNDLLHNSDLRYHLRQLGLQRASHYSWAKTARQTAAVYRQVLDSN